MGGLARSLGFWRNSTTYFVLIWIAALVTIGCTLIFIICFQYTFGSDINANQCKYGRNIH